MGKNVLKFMEDNLKNSMIVNLTKNKFFQQVQKIELISWEWFRILHASQGKLAPKMYSYGNILLWKYLSYFIFD